jgi:hypothetical protein
MPTFVRPNLAAPVRMEMAITAQNVSGVEPSGLLIVDFVGPAGAWVLTSKTVDAGGRTVTSLPDWVQACATPNEPAGEVPQQQCLNRLAAEGYRQVVTYHPAQRFGRFQAIETAIFGVLSLLLIGLSFLRIRPR